MQEKKGGNEGRQVRQTKQEFIEILRPKSLSDGKYPEQFYMVLY